MCLTTDLIRMNLIYVVSPANQVSQCSSRRSALYGFISTTEHLRNEFLETEAHLIASALLIYIYIYIYISKHKENAKNNGNEFSYKTAFISSLYRHEDI